MRFTQPNSLIATAGVGTPLGSPTATPPGCPRAPVAGGFPRGRAALGPEKAVRAYRELRARGELTFAGWIGSLRPAHLDTLSVRDPMPTLVPLARAVRRREGGPA